MTRTELASKDTIFAATAVKTFNSTYLTDATYVANYVRDRVVTVTLATRSVCCGAFGTEDEHKRE